MNMNGRYIVDKTTYVSIFCTLNCSFSCRYCIQRQDDCILTRTELPAKNFLKYTEQLPVSVKNIGVNGGEPTLYYYLFELLRGLTKRFNVTVTSNISGGQHSFDEFIERAKSVEGVRWNTSLHHPYMKPEVYADRILRMRDAGLNVDQIAMPVYPTNQRAYFQAHECLKKLGLQLVPQTMLGTVDGDLYPDKSVIEMYKGFETNIDDYELYEKGFSMKRRMKILCSSNEHLIASDGYVYRCHHDLYTKSNPTHHIEDGYKDTTKRDWCENFGFCNSCDYGRVKFKGIPQQIERRRKE